MVALPSMLPPIMYRSLSFWGKHGSSLTANARLVSGPRATRETCAKHILVVRRQRAATRYRRTTEVSHLLLVLSRQPNHRIGRMLSLDFLLPPWVFVFNHIPEAISSKVVTNGATGSNQRTTRTSKHWNLQQDKTLCSVQFQALKLI